MIKANIITQQSKIDVNFKYNKCNTLEEIDHTLPTLIIGYENAKKYIDGFSILRKEYPKQNIWWTFKKSEKRDEYNEDLDKFSKMLLLKIVENVKYEYIDLINIGLERIKKLIKFIKSSENKNVLFVKDFVFIYSKKYNIVWGLSLSLCEYLGIRKTKIYNIIKNNPYNTIVDFKSFDTEIKKIVGRNTHWLLPLSLAV